MPLVDAGVLTLCESCDVCATEFCLDDLECVSSCSCGCCPGEVRLGPNQLLARGQLLGQRQADLLYYPFNPLATDGTEIPKAILKRFAQTDANGRVVSSQVPFFGIGCPPLTVITWKCGEFRIQDIAGDLYSALQYPGFAKLVDGFVFPQINGLTGPAYGQGVVRLV